MTAKTRFGLEGYGVRRAGSFAGRAAPGVTAAFENPGRRRRDYSTLGFALAVPLALASLGAPVKPAGAASFDLPRRAIAPLSTQQLGSPLGLIAAPAAQPFANYDWPLPRGRTAAIELRTFVNAIELQLVGKDTFFGAPGQPPANLDWPVPKGRVPAIALRGFAQPLDLALVTAPPVIPPTNYDWPLPRGRVPAIELRTFLNPLELQLVGQDAFFGAPGQPPANLDWPVPRRDLRPQHGLGDRSLALLAPAALPPGNYDWPVPRSYARAQHAAGSGSALAILSLPPAPLPKSNYDWPVPRGPIYALSLRTYVDLRIRELVSFIASPRQVAVGDEIRLVEVGSEIRVVYAVGGTRETGA